MSEMIELHIRKLEQDISKLREAAKDFIAGEITVGEFEAVIYGSSVKPDNSLMDKVKECQYCKRTEGQHFDSCKLITNRGDEL